MPDTAEPNASIDSGSFAERRPVLLLIDVEPDARQTSAAADGWKSSELALDHLERFRDDVEQATGTRVQLNWFLRGDPQIEKTWGRADWVAEACPRIIRTIEQRGDYAGIHVHLWRWNAKRQRWSNDLKDSGWLAESLDMAIGAFRNIFGEPPEACRFGDRWLSNEAVKQVRVRGIRYDLTVEPGLPGGAIHDDPGALGALPDFRSAPREPWVPSVDDYLMPEANPANDAMWMLPLTTTPPALRLVRRSPYLMVASRSPNLSLDSSQLWPHIRRELDRPTHAPLVVVFRSGDLAQPRFLRNFTRTTHLLARHPALAYCDFTNPAEAISRWRAARGSAGR